MPTFLKHNQYYIHWCEGCEQIHLVPDFEGKPRWVFNGNFEKPTLTPSVLQGPETSTVCHYFIRDGEIDYCGDCHHVLKGSKHLLKNIPDDEMEWLSC